MGVAPWRLQKAALNIAFNFGQGKSKALVGIYILMEAERLKRERQRDAVMR